MEQTKLTFRADEQCLVKTGGVDKGASKTANYFKAVFDLGANWTEGYDSVKAVWGRGADSYSQILDGENSCYIPNELAFTRGEIQVNLVGSVVEGDVLVERLTTFPILAINITKNARIEGQETQPITASQFDQYVALTNAGASRAEASAEEAEQFAQASSQSAQSANESAESASQSAESASQSAEEAEQASQSVLGLTATASVDSSVGTPSVAVTVETVGDHKVMDFDFHNLKGETGAKGEQGERGEQGEKGETGASGADGFSPTVEVTPTEDGHEVTITDKDGEHTFEVLNGTVEDIYPFLPTDSAQGEIASFTDGANNVPVTDLLVNITPKQDLNGQDAPYPAGGGKNKLQLEGRTIVTSDYNANTNPRDFSTPKAYIGISVNNYFNNLLVSSYTIGSDSISVEAALSGYGVGLTCSVQPNTSYVISSELARVTIGVGYYDADGNFLNYEIGNSNSFVFTTPSNCYNLMVVFRPPTGSVVTYTKPQLEQGTTATTYAPYSNICPISGWTGAVVQRTGINVWDEEWEVGGIDDNTGRLLGEIDRIRSKNFNACVPNTTYYTIDPTNGLNMRVFWYDADKNFISRTAWVGNNSITSPSNACYFKFKMATAYGTTYNNDISINYPSTDTSYHAYQGQTYPISWATEAGTVYGGTLDVTSGLLTVDRAMVDLGTLNWTKLSWGYRTNQLANTAQKPLTNDDVANIMAEKYQSQTYNATTLGVSLSRDGYLAVVDNASTPSGKLVYELATPQTYQLSATEVRTLLGDNNIWADTGSTEVTYRADIQLYIDKQISAVLNA